MATIVTKSLSKPRTETETGQPWTRLRNMPTILRANSWDSRRTRWMRHWTRENQRVSLSVEHFAIPLLTLCDYCIFGGGRGGRLRGRRRRRCRRRAPSAACLAGVVVIIAAVDCCVHGQSTRILLTKHYVYFYRACSPRMSTSRGIHTMANLRLLLPHLSHLCVVPPLSLQWVVTDLLVTVVWAPEGEPSFGRGSDAIGISWVQPIWPPRFTRSYARLFTIKRANVARSFVQR